MYMDNDDDDESPFTPSPNHFSLSIYKENLSTNIDQTKINENLKPILSYKCRLCRKMLDNPILTCSNCVNTGQFCPSKHDTCSNKHRESLLKLLNKTHYDEFQQTSNKKSNHLQCFDRMFLLKKFNLEKKPLQTEFQAKIKLSTETYQISEEIQVRKNRLNLINYTIKSLREQIERKKQINVILQQRITDTRLRVETIKAEFNEANKAVQTANDDIGKRIRILSKQENKLNKIRRERFDELYKYIFPIEQVSAIEEDLAMRIKDLLNAQQTTVDEINTELVENDEIPNIVDYRYQIVNSCLSSNGDYQIDNLLVIANIDSTGNDPESPKSSLSHDLYEVLSALSHACQLINVIAFYLHINLPFRLHQLEFNTNNPTIDCLRADIAKLNANITSSCLSQGIPVEFTNVTYTLENLLELLRHKQYPSRQKPVIYSQNYIDMIERDVNEISRAYVTDYWFDDDDGEKDVTDLLNSDEWEAVPQNDYIPDDPSISETSDSLPSTSSPQHSSIMSNSMSYLKNKSSVLIDSLVRNFKS